MDVDTSLVKHDVLPSMVSCCSERCPHKIRHRSWQGQVYTTVTFDAVSARNGVPLPATFPTYFLSQELDAVVFVVNLASEGGRHTPSGISWFRIRCFHGLTYTSLMADSHPISTSTSRSYAAAGTDRMAPTTVQLRLHVTAAHVRHVSPA